MGIWSILLDVALVAILALCIWRGYKGGIIVGVCAAAALFIALIGANIVATVYSSEFKGALNTFAGGIIDTASTETIGFDGFDEDGNPDDRYVILTAAEKRDVKTVSLNVLKRIGLADDPAEDLAAQTAEESDRVGQSMRNILTEKLCERLAFSAVFFVVFILVAIIFAAIGNIINLSFSLPGAQLVNNIAGAAIGCLNGLVIILFITCLFRYSGILLGKQTVDSTVVARWLTNSNILANIFGI